MSTGFTDEDVGKRVETAVGEPIGVVTMIGDETAYVEVESGVTDSVKAVLDWNADTETVVPICGSAVHEVTADAVRLEGAETRDESAGGTDPVIERDESTVHEDVGAEQRTVGAQHGEATDADDETAAKGEGRSGEAVEPETDAMTESGAERHPESEDQPPQGDRTVTKDRGEREDR